MALAPVFSPLLITAGCGFFGWYLISKILDEEPSCEINVLYKNAARNRVSGVIYHTADIVDSSAMEAVMLKL